ncbi:MAG: hypothetical protein HQL37_01305 [Alphaproteobacteria bacterium]|nr:hypothetical protein [Alphaproteobacteria bacterium]
MSLLTHALKALLRPAYRLLNYKLYAHIDHMYAIIHHHENRIRELTETIETNVGYPPAADPRGVLADVRGLGHRFRKLGDLGGASIAFATAARLKLDDDEQSALDSLLAELMPLIHALKSQGAPEVAPANGRRRVVITSVVWGDKYAQAFTDCLLPSLLAPGNIPALLERAQVILLLAATPEAQAIILKSPAGKLVSEMVELRFVTLPHHLPVAAQLSPYRESLNYWLYGAMQNLTVLFAKELDGDLMLMTPDTIYSNQALQRMFNLAESAYDAVVMTSLRTKWSNMTHWLKARLNDGVIDLTASELTTLALPYIHPMSRQGFMYSWNHQFPLSNTTLCWEVPNGILIHSPHHLPAYISHRALRRDFLVDYFTIDTSLMANIFPDPAQFERIYVVGSLDEIAYFEMTPDGREVSGPTNLFPADTFATNYFWPQAAPLNHWLFTKRVCIPTRTQPGIGLRQLADAEREIQDILDDVERKRPAYRILSKDTEEVALAAMFIGCILTDHHGYECARSYFNLVKHLTSDSEPDTCLNAINGYQTYEELPVEKRDIVDRARRSFRERHVH